MLVSRDYNPLDKAFERKDIQASDFADPLLQQVGLVGADGAPLPSERKTFTRCIIRGPWNVLLLGHCGQDQCRYDMGCQAITVADGVTVVGAAVFENATFEQCVFSSITLLLPAASVHQFSSGLPSNVRWLNPGGRPGASPNLVAIDAAKDSGREPDGGAAS